MVCTKYRSSHEHRQRELISFFLSSATIQARCRISVRNNVSITVTSHRISFIHPSCLVLYLFIFRLARPVGRHVIHVPSTHPIISIDRLTYRVTSTISITVRYSSHAQSSKANNLSFMLPFPCRRCGSPCPVVQKYQQHLPFCPEDRSIISFIT